MIQIEKMMEATRAAEWVVKFNLSSVDSVAMLVPFPDQDSVGARGQIVGRQAPGLKNSGLELCPNRRGRQAGALGFG
jgi:hypothetical protein